MRYSLMLPSEVKDPVDGDHYPDPLSLDYRELPMDSNPVPVEATLQMFLRPDVFFCSAYSLRVDTVSQLVLDYNGVPHRDVYRALVEGGVNVTLFLPTGRTWESLRAQRGGQKSMSLFNPLS